MHIRLEVKQYFVKATPADGPRVAPARLERAHQLAESGKVLSLLALHAPFGLARCIPPLQDEVGFSIYMCTSIYLNIYIYV